MEKYCITVNRFECQLASAKLLGQAVLKLTWSILACVHILLYARLCVMYVAAFARVHIHPCSDACSMPMYLSKHSGLCTLMVYVFTLACVYVHWCRMIIYILYILQFFTKRITYSLRA